MLGVEGVEIDLSVPRCGAEDVIAVLVEVKDAWHRRGPRSIDRELGIGIGPAATPVERDIGVEAPLPGPGSPAIRALPHENGAEHLASLHARPAPDVKD